jgi:hypothetical protein
MMNKKTIVLLKYKLQNMQRELRTIIVMIIAKNLILNVKNVMVSSCVKMHNILHSNCFADAIRITQDHLDSKNFYAFNPSFDKGKKPNQN